MTVQPSTTLRVGSVIRSIRQAIGWTQRGLAARAGVSQALVSAVENGRLASLTFATASRLLEAMGARLIIDASPPFLADRERQRDAAHARCVTYAARRLERAGWQLATEVEVGGDRSRGWIDLLAFNPATGLVLVVEVKTELHDLGAIERSLGWYEREAWAGARRRGWRPRAVTGCLLILATVANDARVRENRETLGRVYPVRAKALSVVLTDGAAPLTGRRAIAMIDPRSRRRAWLRPTRTDGRRSPAPYADYADFMEHVRTH